jgi:hypothetical protein
VNSLVRVLKAPELLLGLWLVNLSLAFGFARIVRSTVAATMGHHAFFDDAHRLAAFAELGVENHALGGLLVSTLAASTILGTLAWLIVAAGAIERLAHPTPLRALASTCVAWLPAMAVQTLYGLILRAALVGGGVFAVLLLERTPVTLIAFVLTWGVSVLVLDRARASVVLGGASRWSPLTTLRALVDVVRRPGLLLAGVTLSTTQWLVAYGIIALSIADPFSGLTIWLARLASLASVLLGLWRLALVVAVPPRAGPTARR